MTSKMFDEADIEILNKSLKFYKIRMNYYLVLGPILIVFSWMLYLAFYSLGLFLTASLISITIWYFPFRCYKRIKAISLDVSNKHKIELRTLIYGKSISKINRLEPNYYIYTDEDTFEVNRAVFNKLQKETKILITYAAVSKTILSLDIIQ